MKLQDSFALGGLLDISSIPDIHESVFLEMLQVNVNICRYLVVKMAKRYTLPTKNYLIISMQVLHYTAIPDSCIPLQ